MRDISRSLAGVLSALLLGVGCASNGQSPAQDQNLNGASQGETAQVRQASTAAPNGFADTKVMEVLPTEKGFAVLLADADGEYVLPIFVAPAQAMSIKLRMERRRYSRPLTHDLMDAIIERLDGKVVKVHVDGVKSGIFVGTVYVQSGGRLYKVDARPSDAIALAVGKGIPIYVADAVYDKAAIPRDELERKGLDRDTVPELSPEPEKEGTYY